MKTKGAFIYDIGSNKSEATSARNRKHVLIHRGNARGDIGWKKTFEKY